MQTLIEPGLQEFSVVFTDRSLNHMSAQFQTVMNGIHQGICRAYNAEDCVLMPGGRSFAMEAVARQFGKNQQNAILRNVWFSYRWTQTFDAISPEKTPTVLKARRETNQQGQPFSPFAVECALSYVQHERPDCLFAAHVETAAGLMLPNDYIRKLGKTVRGNGGLLVLDCVASGAIWVDMQDMNVDILITVPQKGWSSTPSCGVVMLGERALERLQNPSPNGSFALDLSKWHEIVKAYQHGGHAYHATMPTDGLWNFHQNLQETIDFGLDAAKSAQLE